MTVTYSGEVANGSSFGCFWRIICKWRGSVYKLIWRELLAYLCLYFAINFVYRYALNDPQKMASWSEQNLTPSSTPSHGVSSGNYILRVFEKIRQYFSTQSENIPMSFVLGFYVTLIVRRWWEQYRLLPWPDSLALFVSAAIPGQDERGRLMRRNIVRYAMLSYVITLHQVSLRVKRRFPTWQHMVDAGLMMESEKKIFDLMDEKSSMSKYWMPLVWATNIINRARKETLIQNDHVVQTMLTELSDIRKRLGSLIGYDTVCVPLVYTQVVTLSVYTYFVAILMGKQMVAPFEDPAANVTDSGFLGLHHHKGDPHHEPDLYFPFFTALQFCFYIGWLKVAEVLINPFGEDDDDIELNWLIDRHVKAAYMIVDEMHEEHPELLKDQYWEEVVPKDLPYTVASEHYRRSEPKGSAENYRVKESDALYANLLPSRKSQADDVYADYESVDTPLVERRKNWFQRQIHRMGSTRASSQYSSGLFGRNRNHSVTGGNLYSSPESGPNHQSGGNAPPAHKMSLYDRILHRKSGRRHSGSGTGMHRSRHGTSGKMNGAIPVAVKNRPRIPTPDVGKEVAEKLPGMHDTSQTHGYTTELPVVQVVLSPIQEIEQGTFSTASGSGTAALAQAVLSPALTSAGISSVTLGHTPGNVTPVTGSAAMTPTLTRTAFGQPAVTQINPATLTPITVTQVAGGTHMTMTPVTMNGASFAPVSMGSGTLTTVTMNPMTFAPATISQPILTTLGLGHAVPQHPAPPTISNSTAVTLTEVDLDDSDSRDGTSTPTRSRLEGDRSSSGSANSQPPKRGEVYV